MIQQDLIVAKSIEIEANPKEVWEALTDPDIIKEYLYGTETTTDWKPGSKIKFEGDFEGSKYCDKGVVVQNEENKLLSYEYWSGFTGLDDKPENYSLITYTLAAIGKGKTTLTWTQQGFINEEARKQSEDGMDAFLQTFKETVEG